MKTPNQINKKTGKPYKNKAPISQHTKRIFKWFIRPLLSAISWREEEDLFRDGLRLFFHADTRDVRFAYAKEGFSIPNKVWDINRRRVVPGLMQGQKFIRQGTALVVRTDETMPDICELETPDETVYVMTNAQWRVVEEKLRFLGEEV